MILTRLAPTTALVLFLLPIAPAPAAAQGTADVGEGKRLFQGMCGRCHGIDGTGEEGPNLARPTLTRAADDESLRAIIRDGIPDRGMPRVRRMTEANPISFAVDGRQYVAIAAGYALYVFGLP